MDPEGLPVAAMGLAAPVVGHPLPVMGDVVPLFDGLEIPVVHPGPVLLPVAPDVDLEIPVVLPGPALLPAAPVVDLEIPVVHPGSVHLPVARDVVQDPVADHPDHALAALPPADLAPFLACDDIEGNPNPWVQVARHRPPRQQGAHPVAPLDNTGDVDGLEEHAVDEFKDVFWLTKIRQYRVSRRSTNSRRRALVGVRSGPGVFVFNY